MSTNASVFFEKLLQHVEQRIHLEEEEKQYFCSLLNLRTILPKQYLVQQHEVCRYESYVCEGALRSFHVDSQGTEHTLHFAWQDWWISDLPSFLSQQPATRNIVALQKSVLLQIDYKSRDELLQRVPAFEKYWRLLNERACMAQDQRILNTISLSGAERYEALLSAYPSIEQQLSQKHIASYLGITPVFLSQIRRKRTTQ